MVALGKKTVLYDLQPTSLCTIQVRFQVFLPENLLHKVHKLILIKSFWFTGLLFKKLQFLSNVIIIKTQA